MTATTTPPVPVHRGSPEPEADQVVPAAPYADTTVAAGVSDADAERPVTRVESAWRVMLVGFLAFVITGSVRLSVRAPDGAAWLALAGLCLVAALALSPVLIVEARRARGTTRRRRRSAHGRRIPLSSVVLVTIAVVVVVAFDYGLANLAPSRIK